VVALRVFALAAPIRQDDREVYLTVEGPATPLMRADELQYQPGEGAEPAADVGGRDNQHREIRDPWSLSGKEVERSLALRHRSPDVVRRKHSSDRVAGVEMRVVIADGGRCFPQCTAELVPLDRGQRRE
jgi:hypothetical protein